jgi:hypothetical protein
LACGEVTVTATQPSYWSSADAVVRRAEYHGTFGIGLLARHGPIVDVPGRRLLLRRTPSVTSNPMAAGATTLRLQVPA